MYIKPFLIIFIVFFPLLIPLVFAQEQVPPAPGYFKKLCDNENSTWVCNTTDINNVECCICPAEGENFYFLWGCKKPENIPPELCKATGGKWIIDTSRSPPNQYCECSIDTVWNIAEGCVKQVASNPILQFFNFILNFLRGLFGFAK